MDGIPVLDPIENMGITDDSFKKLLQKMESLESYLLKNPLHNSHRLKGLYNLYNHKVELTERIKAVKKKIALAYSVIQLDELKRRKRVLRRLGFISETDVIQLKARVACEISSGDELLLSELLFNRVFNELNTEQTAALLSCFVFEERSDSTLRLPSELDKPFKELQAQARHIARVTAESRITIDEEEYVQRFKPHVMEVVHSWAKGSSFATISRMTDIYEGALIRMFRRLEELLRQLAMAAKVMGNEDLEKKFEEALGKTRRDIVNSGSLYL